MSMSTLIVLNCDKCQEVSYRGLTGTKAREIRAAAKKDGWKLGKQKDFCPSCAKEIAEAVKNAALGLS